MEKRVLYFDCFSGISGDMTVGALLDLGIDKNDFVKEIHKLNLKGLKVEISNKHQGALIGTDFNKMKLNIAKILSNNYKRGQDIEKWDGKTAKRIVEILKKELIQ